MAKTGLLLDLLALNITDADNRKSVEDTATFKAYATGLTTTLAMLKKIGQTNDLDLIVKAEALTLQNEHQKYGREDATVLPSLTAAAEDFSVITSAVKVVREPDAYKTAVATYHTKKAVRGVIADGCHEALNSHIARLGNRMRTVGISVPEKNILRQRQTNMRTAKELYIGLQQEALGVAPPGVVSEKGKGISR